MKRLLRKLTFVMVSLSALTWVVLSNVGTLNGTVQERSAATILNKNSGGTSALAGTERIGQEHPHNIESSRFGPNTEFPRVQLPIQQNAITNAFLWPFKAANPVPKNRVVLCLGVDSRNGEQARSDSILLSILRPKEQKITVISIPRDLNVYVPGNGQTKINHAMMYGGVPLVKRTIQNWLGITIDKTITLDFSGLQTAVDQLGGVDIQVEKNMDYEDPTDGTSIHLKEGYQHLNGKQALDYARFRHDALADTGRMGRQQALIRAMIHTGLKLENWPNLFSSLQIVRTHMKTDFSTLEMLQLAKQYANIQPNAMETVTIEGINRIDPNDQLWYFYANPNEPARIAKLIREKLAG